MKLWGGRFTSDTNKLVEEFTESISYDQQLARYDIQGSLAHVSMLAKTKIIEKEDANKIKAGLLSVYQKIENQEVKFSISDEDIHMNIERLLTEEIGSVAGKLHTARSRNDQVSTDFHLYLRSEIIEVVRELVNLSSSLLEQAEKNLDTILPGYTHLQRAQPVLFAHHLLAYYFMFSRDIERLMDQFKRVNKCPLGAGALAGTGFPIDREYTAKLLNFEGIYENSMDAVADRDFVIEFLSTSSTIMMHLSRFSEECILWSSSEFSFVELDDAYCTGSSIMPQKKNPDVPELVRGKTGRVYGSLMGILTVLKGLPMCYNRDLQEDKEGVFDTVLTVKSSLHLFAGMVKTMKVNKEKMHEAVKKDFSNATDLADYLSSNGIPFREAHEIIGKLVLYCIENDKFLLDLSLEEFNKFSDKFTDNIYRQNCSNARVAKGRNLKLLLKQQIAKIKQN
ncbi:UNVERIFIED_CONTAM: hypothetical protein GTU68_022217 [Idotea baltica]|nr:hypothetical protein [Idotea baltica]